MKSLLLGITVSLCCILTNAQGALSFTSLHAFSVFPKGANPEAALLQASDGNFYGTTAYGGTNGGNGTIFRIGTNGVLSTLHTFTGGSDGAIPLAGLIQGTDGNLYGTTAAGTTNGFGTIFRISTNGAIATLYAFSGGSDSAIPMAGLVQASDGNFYGTASGYSDYGAVFRITTNGTFTTLYSFTGGSDGAAPMAGLIQGTDGNLYGTTAFGGNADGDGTIFRITTNGAFSSLYIFSGGSDSGVPVAGLVQASDGNLYGTASGQYIDNGAVFQITTNGTFTTLYSFTGGSDGATPMGGLVQGADGNLYGTTALKGGAAGFGSIFRITTGGALAALYDFGGGSDGATPLAGLVQARDGNLYGTTAYGNTNNAGTIFKTSIKGNYATWYPFPGSVDGQFPSADLMQGKDGNLYGTTEGGGTTGNGVVFAATPSGAVTLLHSFGTITNMSGAFLDGTFPEGVLVQGKDRSLYGTTTSDGAYGYGTVFNVTTNGPFTVLYSFGAVTNGDGTPLDGGGPEAGLVQGRDGSFYGTTAYGGTSDSGTVFQITTNGAFSTLYSFTGGSDGASPYCTLVQGTDGNLYGTTAYGGDSNGDGTIFRITTNGTLTTLYTFTGGSDSANPVAGLVQANDGNFYGTASGQNVGNGAIFRVTANGTFTTLYSFTGGSDGATPTAGLIQGTDGDLYGTTSDDYTNGAYGTIFRITTNGTFTTLYDFTGGSDGANPDATLVQGGNGTFYGVAENGGVGGMGELFVINLAPVLQQPTKANTTISFNWGAVVGLQYQAQFKTNLAQSGWVNLGSAFVATNGTMQTLDSIGPDPRRFYRVVLLP